MDIKELEQVEKLFAFLVEDYGLKFEYQESYYIGGLRMNVPTYYYSWHNESGCFTIYHLLQFEDLIFYYAKKYSYISDLLCEKSINVFEVEKEIWARHKKWFLCFNHPYFEGNLDRVLPALADVIKAQIDKYGEFFGVKVHSCR